MNLARSEVVEVEQTHFSQGRSSRKKSPKERGELCQESVRSYTTCKREEMRVAWCEEYHQGQAERHRAVLETLIASHEGEAAKLMDVQPEGAAEPGAQKLREQGWRQARGRGGR